MEWVCWAGWEATNQFQDQNCENNYNNCHLLSMNGVPSTSLRIYLCYFIYFHKNLLQQVVLGCWLSTWHDYHLLSGVFFFAEEKLGPTFPRMPFPRRFLVPVSWERCSQEIWKSEKGRSLFSGRSCRQAHREAWGWMHPLGGWVSWDSPASSLQPEKVSRSFPGKNTFCSKVPRVLNVASPTVALPALPTAVQVSSSLQ